MANPQPVSRVENLNPFPRIDDKELSAAKPVQVRVVESDYIEWMKLPVEERNSILRTVIASTVRQKKRPQ